MNINIAEKNSIRIHGKGAHEEVIMAFEIHVSKVEKFLSEVEGFGCTELSRRVHNGDIKLQFSTLSYYENLGTSF